MLYRPRQQRVNPFSLMNHEMRQRHRNTLKGEMRRPCAFFCCFLTLPLPRYRLSFFPILSTLSIYLRPLSFFFTVAVRFAALRPPLPPSATMLSLYSTCTCSEKREFFLK